MPGSEFSCMEIYRGNARWKKIWGTIARVGKFPWECPREIVRAECPDFWQDQELHLVVSTTDVKKFTQKRFF